MKTLLVSVAVFLILSATAGHGLASIPKPFVPLGQASPVDAVAFSPDGQLALSAGGDAIVRVWQLATGRKIRTLRGHITGVMSVAFSPDGRLVLSGGWDNKVKVWDVATGHELRTLRGHSWLVKSVAFSPDGRLALSGSQDKTIKIWEVATGREIRTLRGHSGGVDSVAFSPDGRLALSGSFDKTIKIWEVATGREIRTLRGHSSLVKSVAFSPDGRLALSGSFDRTLKVWEVATGQELRTLRGHSRRVYAVAFSPDGRLALSGSDDATVKIWEVATGREIRTLRAHSFCVSSVGFSPDGRLALSGGDESLKVWDVATGREIAQLVGFHDGEWVAITPEGYFNASAKGAEHINVRIGDEVYGMDNFARRFYRPAMVQLALGGKPLPAIESIYTAAKKPAPSVKIISPRDNSITSADEAEIKVKIRDNGGGIGDVYLYLNDSLVSTDTRAIKIRPTGNSRMMTFNVPLSQGKNRIKIIAHNRDNSMSSHPKTLLLTSDYKFGAPTLYVLAVGIDMYVNDELNLRYAVADAKMFARTIKHLSSPLFKDVKVVLLTKPEETTKGSITKAFEKLSNQARAGDYFIFYGSSHGYIATFNNGDSGYFMVTSNVIFLDPMNLKKDAISQDELVKLIGGIPAQNKVIVLDSCHSGEAGRVIQIAMANTQKTYTRALSTATAMQLLRMASGSSVFTASQSVEEAIEGYKGHGLFTYTLVEGLKGKADENRDKFITLSELKGYVERNVFIRSKKQFQRKQIPYINIGTLDLSLVKAR